MGTHDDNRTNELTPSVATRRDSGSSFIEILVSIVLLGTAGLAVLAGLAATVRSGSVHDRVATAQAQLADAGDVLSDTIYIDGVGDPYFIDCAVPTDYDGLLAAPEWSDQAVSWPDVTVESVQFWNGTNWDGVGACASTNQLQRITLRATIDDRARELNIVKRRATQAGFGSSAWNDDMVEPEPNCGFTSTCP